ncbi:MAG: NAD(P)H-hydrate dehydratase [Nitrospinota bacterium]|nr:MAG: NAD(P)H-hydrate dehydratase [Nitrospinota bacterium]
MKVVTAQEMRTIDQRTVTEYRMPSLLLMERAGMAVAQTVQQRYPDQLSRGVAVFAGKGNNGGDGFAAARNLLRTRVPVTVFLLAPREAVRGDARTNLEMFAALGGEIVEITTEADLPSLQSRLGHYGLFIDALLGTGLNSAVSGIYATVITLMNAQPAPTVAIDIPSGLSADSGKILGPHVWADCTVTLALPKPGLLLYPAARAVGELEIADIGIPLPLLHDPSLRLQLLEAEEIAGLVCKPRDPDTHKGTYGHVLIVAGSPGKTGAGALASLGALYTGAGLVTYALPQGLNLAMESRLLEVMTFPLPETGAGTIGEAAFSALEPLFSTVDVVVIGPGISAHPETGRFLERVVQEVDLPLVIDADGINHLARNPALLEAGEAPRILTPHPGEMARLVGLSTAAVQENRIEVAREFVQKYRGTYLILKGARTLVAGPDGHVAINPTGNAGMATAGTGDVLSGMVGSFIGQGLPPREASQVAVFLHGLAGDLAREEKGERGLVAGDILHRLPQALQRMHHLPPSRPAIR